jgi:hypothetical protein
MYHGQFSNKQDIAREFEIPEETLDNLHIHYAFYDYEDYIGDALVIYTDKEGKLYEVNGSHSWICLRARGASVIIYVSPKQYHALQSIVVRDRLHMLLAQLGIFKREVQQ